MEEAFRQFLSGYPFLAPFGFVIVRALAIIIAPIPGAFVDIAGIAAFGWVKSFFLAEAGVMGGAVISFLIARRFREPIATRFVSLQKLREWEGNLSGVRRFWGLVLLRLFTSSLFDYISYAAGLTAMKMRTFFFASLIGNIPGLLAFYYFGGLFYQKGWYYAFVGVAVLLVLFGFFTDKGKGITRLLTDLKILSIKEDTKNERGIGDQRGSG